MIAPEKLIYLDESGVSTQMTRLYARGLGGARIHEGTPDGRWKILTILGAIEHPRHDRHHDHRRGHRPGDISGLSG